MSAKKRTFVIKCGGSTLAALPESFFNELSELNKGGEDWIIVHGGGPAISEMLSGLDVESEFVQGLRRTTSEVLDVVEMVLAGKINKEVVRRVQEGGASAIGLSGIDGRMMIAEPVANADEIGFVGQVTSVNATLLQGLLALGQIPVIAPLGIDVSGQHYNINADTAAGAVASAVGARQLIVVTDVSGILKEVNGIKKVLPTVTRSAIEEMIASGEIYGGMIPKVQAAMQCIHGDVAEVMIVNGTEPNVLSRVLAGEEVGTRIVKEEF